MKSARNMGACFRVGKSQSITQGVAVPPVRILALICSVLVVATVWLWNTRYRAETGGRAVAVRAESGSRLVMEAIPGGHPLVERIDLPVRTASQWLHVEFSCRADRLEQAAEPWQVGRLILEWCGAEGEVVARDTLTTMKDTDKKARHNAMVVRARKAGLRPVLRIEHLGRSGRMEVDGLRVDPVVERMGQRWWTILLLAAWAGWLYGLIRTISGTGMGRGALAACLVLVLAWLVVLPGPWPHARPLGGSYEGDIRSETVESVDFGGARNVAGDRVAPLGSMPIQGGLLVKVKIILRNIRPVLHVLLFAGPAFMLTLCCGSRCAWCCGLLIALLGESAQAGLWGGFGWDDVLDLAVNTMGMAFGIRLARHGRLEWLRGKIACQG